MLDVLLILSLLVWLPALFYGISRQGLVLILFWLLTAPVVLNVVKDPGTNPFFGIATEAKDAGVKAPSHGPQGGYLTQPEATVKLKELLEPTRILFGAFFIVFLLETVLKKRRLGPFDNTEKFACIFALMLIASALFLSKRTPFSIRVACDAFIIPFIAYFCARRLVTCEEQLRKLTQIIGYLGVCLIIIGLIERVILDGLFARVNGPFWSRNELYNIMAVVFFAVWLESVRTGQIRNTGNVFPSLVRQFVLCLSPVIVLLGWGRGNLLGLLSGAWIFMFLGRRLVDFRSRLATVGLALLLGPILVVGLFGLTPEEIVESRISRTSTIYARIGAWENIVDEIGKSPVFGIGLNNLRDVLYQSRSYVEGVKSETLAHNSFLSLAGELGLVGLLAYLAIAGSIIRTGLILYRTGSSSRERWQGITVISIMVAYLLPALFDTTLYFPSVSHIYVYVFVGGVAGLHGRSRSLSALFASRADSRWMAANVRAGAR